MKAQGVRRSYQGWKGRARSMFPGILILLVACSSVRTSSNLGPTPDIPNWGSTPTVPGLYLPALDCSRITTVSPGPTWSGLTIGVSTFEDVQARFAPVEGSWNTFSGSLGFSNLFRRQPSEFRAGSDPTWIGASACFVGNILSALAVSGNYEFGPLGEWVAAYGQPDRVTWGSFYTNRSLIWAEEGLLVFMSIDTEYPGDIVLFSPMPRRKLANSWVMDSLPKDGREWKKGNTEPLPPGYEDEDPWDIER